MGNFEFVRYEATPGEKHLGIATVKAYGRIVLRYKIVPNKDGSGFFPAAASYKLPSHGGEDAYISAFLLDSRSEEEEPSALCYPTPSFALTIKRCCITINRWLTAKMAVKNA